MIFIEKFKENFAPGHYSRVNTTHPLDIFVGIDEQCQYSLEFRGNFIPKTIKSSNAISVKQYQKNGVASIVFSLNEKDMLDNFCVFCDDIIHSTANTIDVNIGYKMVVNRFYSWKKMFQTRTRLMDESKIMGLIGELLFLKEYMFPKYGYLKSLRSWSGLELTHKDFSLDSIWYEVKAINAGKDSVKISSLEQLQSTSFGEIIIYQLEKMSPEFNGVKINKLASSILNQIDTDECKDIFINKLVDNGFDFESIYSEYVYNVSLFERFLVNDKFPKLTRHDVNNAIVNVQYELSLSFIQEFKID